MKTGSNSELVVAGVRTRVQAAAQEVIQDATEKASKDGVSMRLDYVELNWADTFEPVEELDHDHRQRGPVILSGAVWIGRTRLIDNLIVGDADGQLLL